MDLILSAKNINFNNMITYPSIEIARNRVTFICGESGSGKSTLLKIFNATITPQVGEIYYNNQLIDTIDSVELRKEIILVSQSVFLFDGSIENNFNKYYEYRELPQLTTTEIEKYLSLCLIDLNSNSKCETLSGGERQRVFIAVCISMNPKILMLDEPTSALDEATANRIIGNIKTYCLENEITLIVISHDKILAKEYADEIISLEKKGIL